MGDKGRTGAFFDHCRYLRSKYQPRHGLVRAWADTLRQRTTLDVLNAQHARVALVTAQHDGVVTSYTLLAALGGALHAPGLNVLIYDPMVTIGSAWIWRA
jgi:hypothetical protein